MAKVGRVTGTVIWHSWAATRASFAELVKQIVGAASQVANVESIAISLPAFDRPFESPDEFLENVSSRDWLNNHRFAVHLVTDADGLAVEFSGQWDGRVELSLYGGSSMQRNALQPELRTAIGSLSRSRNRFAAYIRGGSVVLGGALVLGALALAIVFNDELFDAGVVAFGAAYFLVMLGGPVLAAAVAGASDSYASRVLPSVEFLPDSGKSQWDRGSSRASFPGRLRDRRARAASSNRAAPV